MSLQDDFKITSKTDDSKFKVFRLIVAKAEKEAVIKDNTVPDLIYHDY